MDSPVLNTASLRMVFCSSRTLPVQFCALKCPITAGSSSFPAIPIQYRLFGQNTGPAKEYPRFAVSAAADSREEHSDDDKGLRGKSFQLPVAAGPDLWRQEPLRLCSWSCLNQQGGFHLPAEHVTVWLGFPVEYHRFHRAGSFRRQHAGTVLRGHDQLH